MSRIADCCAAIGRVTVTSTGTGSSLDLCSHHFQFHADALLLAGFTLVTDDTREELVVKAGAEPVGADD